MGSSCNRNVIVLMEDSFRRDHLGCYGNPWIKTPNIDRLSSESAVFDFAYAEGLPTIPVRTALFTGRYTLPFRGWQPLEQNDVVLAEVLWDKGLTTALIADTYHMHYPQRGFSRGFDFVQWIRGQEMDPSVIGCNVKVNLSQYSEKNWQPAYWEESERVVKKQFEQYLKNRASWKTEEDHHIAVVVRAAVKWLEETIKSNKNRGVFLWIDSFDPHEPWDPPVEYADMYPAPEYNGLPIIWGGGSTKGWSLDEIRHVRSQYAGTLTLCDKWTGLLLEKVKDLGLSDNTMIIFLSDHGEPLGEHGIVKKTQPWPYEELSRIPLMIRMPDGMQDISKGQHMDAFVGMPDVTPTILDFLDVGCPNIVQGRSLLPTIMGEESAPWEFAISGHYGNSWSIRNREYSYYYWPGADQPYTWGVGFASLEKKVKPELYKLDVDYVPSEPGRYELEDQPEKTNVIEEHQDKADSLGKEMRRLIEGLSPSSGDLMAKDYQKRRWR